MSDVIRHPGINPRTIERGGAVGGDSAETGKEKGGKKNLAVKIAAGAVAAAVLAGAGYGIGKAGASKTPEVVPGTTIENTDNNSNNSTETTTSETTETTTENYEAKIEEYSEMSVDEFESLPREERLMYADYLVDKITENGSYDWAYGHHPDRAVEMVDASLDNTGQEIVDNNMYVVQAAWLQADMIDRGVDGIDFVFNASDAQKVLSAAYYVVGSDSDIYYSSTKEQLEVQDSRTAITNRCEATSASELSEDGNLSYKTVDCYDPDDGSKIRVTFYYCEFINYKGEQDAYWLTKAK